MDRFRSNRFGGGTPSSKASATTTCQKCLKRGHYSYECKETLQSRPYHARPSRTQQLLNPKLAPKLNMENPNELLKKQGAADETLARIERERGREHLTSSGGGGHEGSRVTKRSRSMSSSSSTSVSTISTRHSHSPPRRRSLARRENHDRDTYLTSQLESQSIPPPRSANGNGNRKRQRQDSTSSSTSDSYSTHDSRARRRSRERNNRRRRGSHSPAVRGRRRTRSYSVLSRNKSRSITRRNGEDRRSRRLSSGSIASYNNKKPHDRRGRGAETSRSRFRNSSSISDAPRRRARSQSRKRLRSRSGSRTPRSAGRRPLHAARRVPSISRSRSRSRSPFRPGMHGRRNERPLMHQQSGRSHAIRQDPAVDRTNGGPSSPSARKERSLSPYSKRVALTQSMQRP